MAIFDDPQNLYPLTNHPKIGYRWLGRLGGPYGCPKFGANPPMGLLGKWVKYSEFFYLYFFFGNSPTGQTRRPQKAHLARVRVDDSKKRGHCGWSQYAPTKSKMADGRHFAKSVKSPYLFNLLNDFDEIWHDDTYWHIDRPLKFHFFENQRWRWPPSWKSQKSRYLRDVLTDLYEIWYGDLKWVINCPGR